MALGGFMGAGKSTVGRALAARLDLPFLDMDRELEARFGPIPEQFAREGEQAFRARERALVREWCGGAPAVIALGGGALVDPDSAAVLRSWGWVIGLDVPLEVAAARVGAGETRPLWDAGLEERHRQRRPIYRAHAHRVFEASGAVEQLVDAIAGFTALARRVPVPLGDRAYDVLVQPDLAGLGAAVARVIPSGRVVLVTEDTVGPLWGATALAALRRHLDVPEPVVLPAGEANKTVATWSACVDGLLDRGIDRRTAVVALGGGVLGDIAGFAAASVLRGVPFVQVPTTVLSMVDSSVGGKTAVDHARGKNLVGAFHQPRLVLAALETLQTLDPREVRAGLAEVVKIALLGDSELFVHLEEHAAALRAADPVALAPVIARAVALKAEVVAEDERETGRRAVLNLGHTVGHAIEVAAGYGAWLHGEAVGLGMVAEALWAESEGICEPGVALRLTALLAELGLPTASQTWSAPTIRDAVGVDKKREGGMLRLPVPVRVGASTIHRTPSGPFADAVIDVLATLRGAS